MPEKSPETYSILTYGWVFALAIAGGVVSFYRKLQTKAVRIFNLIEFVGEIVTSAFAGVLTFWMCEHSNVDPLLSAALVGIAGHMGSRAIFLFEDWLAKHFPKT